MTLRATEFLRRFLLHVLPTGFVRIRRYGFLANRACRSKLELCRNLLSAAMPPVAAEPVPGPQVAVDERPKAHACPACGEGRMVVVEALRAAPVKRRGRPERGPIVELVGFDTS